MSTMGHIETTCLAKLSACCDGSVITSVAHLYFQWGKGWLCSLGLRLNIDRSVLLAHQHWVLVFMQFCILVVPDL